MAFTTIDDSGSFFSQKNYTGTSSELAITGVGFQPDLIWLKDRDQTYYNTLFDSVRGVTKLVYTNATNVEETDVNAVTAFGADGFTIGSSNNVNYSGDDFACWNWKAGTTTGIATNGSTTITPSSYSFNQTSGFSILKYTGNSTSGAKLAHGLGATPTCMMFKNLTAVGSWINYWESIGNTSALYLNDVTAVTASTTFFNDTSPDSVNLTLGNNAYLNTTYDYLAYCFAPVQGFSTFGTYTGTNNSDGPMIYTGFRPAMLIVKKDGTTDWVMYNPTGQTYNEIGFVTFPNTTAAEGSNYKIDFLANGFKFRDTAGNTNASATYYYMAFAEAPFVTDSGTAPANAR